MTIDAWTSPASPGGHRMLVTMSPTCGRTPRKRTLPAYVGNIAVAQDRMSEETKHYRNQLQARRPLSSQGEGRCMELHEGKDYESDIYALHNNQHKNTHWISWNTGDLEPPGLQRRLIQPWPTPAPRLLAREDLATYGMASTEREAALRYPNGADISAPSHVTVFRSHATMNKPSGTYLRRHPSSDYDQQTLLTLAPNFRAWHTPGWRYHMRQNHVTPRHLLKSDITEKIDGDSSHIYQHDFNKHRKIMSDAYRSHTTLDLGAQGGYFKAPVEYYPIAHHHSRQSGGEEFVNHDSNFSFTQPPARGHFIIHPDWVSERNGMKPKSAKHFTSSKGPHGFRYGSP